MDYSITKEIRIHHEEGWFYQFTDDGEDHVEFSSYDTSGVSEIKQGESHFIPKDCIDQIIKVLEQLK